jgi:uncharacterized coiled-coil protein SlyX
MPTKTRTADSDKRVEELRRLIAMQDTKFEEANAKITAANQKIEGVDAKIDAVDAKMNALNAKLELFITQEETMVEDKTNVMEYIDAKVTELLNAKIAEGLGSTNEIIERQIAKSIGAIETNMSDTIEAIVDSKFETCDDAFNHTFAVYKTKVDEHEEATIEIINKHKAATIGFMNETVDAAKQALYEERDDEERNAIVQAIVDSYYEDKRIAQEQRVRDAIVKFETKKCSYSLILEEMASKAHDTNNRVDQLRDIVYESEEMIAMQHIPQKIKEIETRMKNNSKFNINTRNNLNELEYKVDQSKDIVDGYEKMATTQFGNQMTHVMHRIKELEISMQDDRKFNINTRRNLNELEYYANDHHVSYDHYYQGQNTERLSRKLPRMTPPPMNEEKLFDDIKTHLVMETPTHAGGVIDNDNDG